MEKPSVFIGSSTEGLQLAEAVFEHLSRETRPKLWTHQLFLPGQYPMETLEKQLRVHNFAILVASPDDQIIKRDAVSAAMRDNLLLEFGLFTGALGRKRVFFICPTTPKIELPSDLMGVIVATYDSTRVKKGVDEIAAATQVPCQQIRSVINEEWRLIQDETEKRSSRIQASEKGKSVKRLYSLVVQLRDAVIIVQRDAFAAVSDEQTFKKVKKTAIVKVRTIAQSFEEDAILINVGGEVTELALVTTDALSDLPFPRELSVGKEATREKVINTGLGALDSFLSGGDPFQHVQNVASDEANMRVSSLMDRYMEWWDNHYPLMEKATASLQDRLFQAAIDLAMIAHTDETTT